MTNHVRPDYDTVPLVPGTIGLASRPMQAQRIAETRVRLFEFGSPTSIDDVLGQA